MTRAALRTVAFAVAFVGVYAAAVLTPLGQQLDAATLGAFGWLSPVGRWLAGPLRVALAVAAGCLAVIVVVSFLASRRWLSAVRVAVAVAAVAGGGELLKQLVLPRPDLGSFGYAQNTLPSVHAAFVAVGFTAALRALPPGRARRRLSWISPVAMFLGGLVGPLSYAHRASDSLAALMLVGAAQVLLPTEYEARAHRHPFGPAWLLTAGAAVGAALLALAAATGTAAALGIAVTVLIAVASAAVTLATR